VLIVNLVLPLPPTGNHYKKLVRVRGRLRFFRTRATEEFLRSVRLAARRMKPLAGPVSVNLQIFRRHKRGDIDGWLKVSLDSLQGVAYKNDSQIRSLLVSMDEDKEDPRLVVDVFPYVSPAEKCQRLVAAVERFRKVDDTPAPKGKLIALATPNYRAPKGKRL
jgi:crossover junction endodeoxyribonuclease RusA